MDANVEANTEVLGHEGAHAVTLEHHLALQEGALGHAGVYLFWLNDHNALVDQVVIDFSLANGDRPVHARSSHLDFLKKAVSYFMPDNAPHWCNGQGNPTKHNMHRKLIDIVKKCEVRGEGAESKVKRALTIPELYKELEMLRKYGVEHNDCNYSVKYTAMTL